MPSQYLKHQGVIASEVESDSYDPTQRVSQADVGAVLFTMATRYGVWSNGRRWLKNGASAYVDANTKLEYAGAECTNGYDAMLQELAGLIFYAIVARNADRDLGRDPKIWIFKTNTSLGGASSGGNHINFSIPNTGSYSQDLKQIMHLLKAFFVTMPVLFGAGMVLPRNTGDLRINGPRYGYVISSRGYHVTRAKGYASNSSAIGNKPLFLYRDEPHAKNCHRIQVCGLDSNILPGTIQLKYDLILLLVEMAVAGAIKPIIIREPYPSDNDRDCAWMREISQDWKVGISVEGGAMTSSQIQWHYWHQALAYVDKVRGGEGREHLERWAAMLLALNTDEVIPTGNYGLSDWVTKALHLARYDDRRDKPLTAAQAEHLHFMYHAYRVGSAGCTPLQLARLFGPPGVLQQAVRSLHHPPRDTRARGRGEFVRVNPSGIDVSWDTLAAIGLKFKIGDPLEVMPPELMLFLDRSRAKAALCTWADRRYPLRPALRSSRAPFVRLSTVDASAIVR